MPLPDGFITLFKKNDSGRIINEIRTGSQSVHPALFDAWSANLQKAVSGVLDSDTAGSAYFDLQQKLQLNVARFAAAKAFQATQFIRREAAGQDGTPRSDDEFNRRAGAVLNMFGQWQKTEYNTAVSRTRTARQWHDFNDDPARNTLLPNIKWLPSRSVTLREEHIPFYNRVWAKNDPFWLTHQPGSLWNCKCDWIETDEPADGMTSNTLPPKGLKGNPAETGEVFSPDASCFTQNASSNMAGICYKDRISNLQISVTADKNEIADNVRTGRILLDGFKDMSLSIRPHRTGAKNPEYEISGKIADAKRIESWNVAAAFNAANKQGCRAVILDLFKLQNRTLNTGELAKNIVNRYHDFMNGTVGDCYVVWNNKSMVVKKDFFRNFSLRKRHSYTEELKEFIERDLK